MSVLAALLLFAGPAWAQFTPALPGYQYSFPRDYFDHPDYQTEWWYTTGNLKAANGRRFGFELTFFREGVARDTHPDSPWQIEDVYLAHLALSDLDGARFYYTERLNRAGPGLAGASEAEGRVWNGNWQVRFQGRREELQAVASDYALQLDLEPLKPPVIHGNSGVSQKSAGAGHASHYFSLTRIRTRGTVKLNGRAFAVQGLSWMDHEFFTQQLTADQVGWDWFSLQLQNGTELMLFELRLKNGGIDPHSAGTYVDAQGRGHFLALSDFELTPGKRWKSPATGGRYPVAWSIGVPSLGLALQLTTPLDSQELASKNPASPSYWEGAIRVQGQEKGAAIRGAGYLEMTGASGAVRLSQ